MAIKYFSYEKSIDDKGRLGIFGLRINMIDFMLLVLLFCLLVMFYSGYNRVVNKSALLPPQIIKPSKQLYEEEIALLNQQQEEKEYREKLIQLKQNTASGYKETTEVKIWERSVKCYYCDYPLIKKLKFGESAENKEIEVICDRCGKKQKVNFSIEAEKERPIDCAQKYQEEIAKKEVIFRKHPRLRKYFK